MIAFKHRFHGHGSLRFVYQNGKTIRGQLFSIKYATNKRRADYRVAVVVSKKISKSAVKRNRMRRRLYEAFRKDAPSIHAPYDIVITVFSDQVMDVDFTTLSNTLTKQLEQASVIS